MTLNLNFWYKQTGDTRFCDLDHRNGLVVTVGLNVWLVPALGYVGAAWGRLGCETVMLALSFWLNSRYYPTPYNVRRIGGLFPAGRCDLRDFLFYRDVACGREIFVKFGPVDRICCGGRPVGSILM